VALAIVSTKPEGYFSRGAGGYFAAMVKRPKTGELNLDRSLWKLRRERRGGRRKGGPVLFNRTGRSTLTLPCPFPYDAV
jgi:hypothetical protein